MAQAMKEAVDAARDEDSAIVTLTDDHVRVTFTGDVSLIAEDLIQEGWLISPSSAREQKVQLFSSR